MSMLSVRPGGLTIHMSRWLPQTASGTTLAPTLGGSFDAQETSRVLGCPVLHIWFDDDIGVSVRAHDIEEFIGELSLHPEYRFTQSTDAPFLKRLHEVGVLSSRQHTTLVRRLSNPIGLWAWVRGHGLERLLEVPSFDPVPVASAEIPVHREPERDATALTDSSADTGWDVQVVDLHCEYWLAVFSMNNWKLYNAYKKHLPANQREDVDKLCSAVGDYDEDAIEAMVKSILSRIWSCEDWDAIIRDPAIEDGDDETLRDWRALLESTRLR